MTIAARTTNGFGLIDFNSDDWHTEEWANWQLLDALLLATGVDTPLPTVGGTANAITLDYSPNATITNGTKIIFVIGATPPSGATTVAIDGGAAIDLKVNNEAVEAGDLIAGDIVQAIYDGTVIHVLSPLRQTSKTTLNVGASGATPNAVADDLVIHNNDDAGISVLTPNNKKGSIAFGDPESAVAGLMQYDHATNTWLIKVNAVDTLEISANGIKALLGYFTMNLAGANDFWIKEVSSNVVRFGSSGASTGFSIDVATGNVTFHNGLSVDDLTVVDDVTVGGDLAVTGSIDGTLAADIEAAGNIVRATKGAHVYYSDAAMVGARIFVAATGGADPTSSPGDIWIEY